MNCSIRIYPAARFKDVDMAVLMEAALMQDGVLHGCEITKVANKAHIGDGRIAIRGRLGVVTEGDIDHPLDLLATQDCYITAICDLAADPPFQIEILTAGDHAALVARAEQSESNFNTANGVAYLDLGMATVNPSEGVTAVSFGDDEAVVAKSNKKSLDAAKADIESQITTLDEREADHKEIFDLWLAQIRRRWHKRSNFVTYIVTGDGIQVPANTSKTFKFRKDYGSLVYVRTGSGSSATSQGVAFVEITPEGSILSEAAPSSVPGAQEYDGEHHIPTNVNDEKIHFGINGISIDNATSGGTGAANCVLQAFYTEGNYVCAKIRNVGSSVAKLKLGIRSFYIVNPDF